MYSVPGLGGATYNWTVPPDWSISSGSDSSLIEVLVGNDPGTVAVTEQNSCANLKASMNVVAIQPTVAGAVTGGMEVCTGMSTVTLTTAGNRGSVIGWLATAGGVSTPLNDTTAQYTAVNLTATTLFQALIQNGQSCAVDTTSGSTVLVDPRSVGGTLNPASLSFCQGQNKDALLQLQGDTGNPVNWQSSADGIDWTSFAPLDTTSEYSLAGLTASTDFRVIVQSGVCPPDTSAIAAVSYVNVPFPQATYAPVDTIICYNTAAYLHATITIGTNYAWSNTGTMTGVGNDQITSLPYTINPVATPKTTTSYVLSVENAGCPNLLLDTFQVRVLPPVIVNAGNDTAVVIGEPLQLNATSNDTTSPGGDGFVWTPDLGLNNPNTYDPVGVYTGETDSVRYIVTATTQYGCIGTGTVSVKVFKTAPDIFVPNAFTPGGPTNEVFRPVPVGISSLQFFRVYNRWGQLVYSTTRIGDGWDGRVGGRLRTAVPMCGRWREQRIPVIGCAQGNNDIGTLTIGTWKLANFRVIIANEILFNVGVADLYGGGYSQSQECPPNIDWSLGNLTHWFAYTGNNMCTAMVPPPSNRPITSPSLRPPVRSALPPFMTRAGTENDSFGIKVISSNFIDRFGNFPAIPTIDGYTYGTTVRLGSTIVSGINTVDTAGGYVRGLGYRFTSTAGARHRCHTRLTYAYASL